jgi:hypothetical protein
LEKLCYYKVVGVRISKCSVIHRGARPYVLPNAVQDDKKVVRVLLKVKCARVVRDFEDRTEELVSLPGCSLTFNDERRFMSEINAALEYKARTTHTHQ